MGTLTVTATHDFSNVNMFGVTSIVYATSAASTATFGSNQFGTHRVLGFTLTEISDTVAITGDANRNLMVVELTAPGTFSAAGWTFTNWDSANDVVSLVGTAGSDTITGTAQADHIIAVDGVDHLFGGDGNDTFLYQASPQGTVDGGSGFDIIQISSGNRTYDFGAASIDNVERLLFATANNIVRVTGDQLGAGAMTEVLAVTTGNKLVVAGDHVDLSPVAVLGNAIALTIDGVQGAHNALTGSARDDAINGGALSDTINGGAGNDTLAGGGGADALNGGTGEDTATYAASFAAVQVNLATSTATGGDAQGDALTSIENVTGSAFGDLLAGNALANKLVGGDGNDELTGGLGGDLLDGGTGQNTARYDASSGAVQINLVTGFGTGADAQGDVLINVQNLVGTNFADTLIGDGNANIIFGGGGNDLLAGGGGADLFVFTSAPDTVANVDAITDFQLGLDTIELAGSVFVGLAPGALSADAFGVGSAAADATDRIVYDPTTGALFFDADGSGVVAQAEFATVTPGLALTAAAFVVI